MNPAPPPPRPPPPRAPPPKRQSSGTPDETMRSSMPSTAPPPPPPAPGPTQSADSSHDSTSAPKLSFSAVYPNADTGKRDSSQGSSPTDPGNDDKEEDEDEPMTLDDVDIKLTLTNFYLKYAPDKIDRIDLVLSKYKDEEGELFDDLASRYAVSEEEMRGFLVRKRDVALSATASATAAASPTASSSSVRSVPSSTMPVKPVKPVKLPKPAPGSPGSPGSSGSAPMTLGRALSMRIAQPPPSASASASASVSVSAGANNDDDDDEEEEDDGEAERAERASIVATPPIRQGPLTKIRVRDGQAETMHFILREDALYYIKRKPLDGPRKFLARLTGWDLGTSTLIERNTRSIDMTKLMATPCTDADILALGGNGNSTTNTTTNTSSTSNNSTTTTTKTTSSNSNSNSNSNTRALDSQSLGAARLPFSFALRSKRKSFYLMAASLGERDGWLADIELTRAVAQLQAAGAEAEAGAGSRNGTENGEAGTGGLVTEEQTCPLYASKSCSRNKVRIPRLDDRMLFKVCNKCSARLKEARRYGAASVI